MYSCEQIHKIDLNHNILLRLGCKVLTVKDKINKLDNLKKELDIMTINLSKIRRSKNMCFTAQNDQNKELILNLNNVILHLKGIEDE